MDGQTKISSPPYHHNPSDSRPAHFTPIRPDHSSSLDLPGSDGYESNRSPTASTPMNDSGNSKRRKVNHGTTLPKGF